MATLPWLAIEDFSGKKFKCRKFCDNEKDQKWVRVLNVVWPKKKHAVDTQAPEEQGEQMSGEVSPEIMWGVQRSQRLPGRESSLKMSKPHCCQRDWDCTQSLEQHQPSVAKVRSLFRLSSVWFKPLLLQFFAVPRALGLKGLRIYW